MDEVVDWSEDAKSARRVPCRGPIPIDPGDSWGSNTRTCCRGTSHVLHLKL